MVDDEFYLSKNSKLILLVGKEIFKIRMKTFIELN